MSVGLSWQTDDEHRIRRATRQRAVAKLSLVPPVVKSQEAASVPVIPADYLQSRLNPPSRLRMGALALIVSSVGAHAGLAWWLLQPVPGEPVKLPVVPPIEVVLTPPEVPPMVEPPPPPPPPPPPKPVVPKPKAEVPKPKPKPVVPKPVPKIEPLVPPPVTPPPAPVTPTPVVQKYTGAKAYAAYLSNPPPKYPPAAMRKGWEGTVLLKVLVTPTGQPSTIQLAKSSGRHVLDDAAIAAVKKWRFAPAKRGDTPVEGWVSFPIEFNLDN